MALSMKTGVKQQKVFLSQNYSRKCRNAKQLWMRAMNGMKGEVTCTTEYFERKCLRIVTKMTQKWRDNNFTAKFSVLNAEQFSALL